MRRISDRMLVEAGPEPSGGWSVWLLYALTKPTPELRRLQAVTLGWGWDAEHPLRPWPWFSRRWEGEGWCLSCCGFFITYRDGAT